MNYKAEVLDEGKGYIEHKKGTIDSFPQATINL